jgi:pimeloyl-ACP methyl ester carboxylesterase
VSRAGDKVELCIPVGPDGVSKIAMTVHLPDPQRISGRVIFASPGGGYARGYYDMSFAGHQGYSQAQHHIAQGHIVVAFDHLGVGGSSTEGDDRLSIEEIADRNDEAIREVAERLRRGTLVEDFPALPNALSIGIGQSMGGGVTILMQARHRSFDAIGVLGYSAIHTVMPQRSDADVERGIAAYDFDRATPASSMSMIEASAQVADFRYPFHWEDVPADIVAADMDAGFPIRQRATPFGSMTIPNCALAMMSRGFVREEAAAIDVPVFLGFGERDTSRNPHDEPSAYTRARDVTLCIVPRMAHMHNFASTRRRLWDRISGWASNLQPERAP